MKDFLQPGKIAKLLSENFRIPKSYTFYRASRRKSVAPRREPGQMTPKTQREVGCEEKHVLAEQFFSFSLKKNT